MGNPTNNIWPSNGTAYLNAALGETLLFRFADGSLFDLLAVDLAEYSTVVPKAVSVRFVGYFPDGSTIVETRTTDGIMDGGGPLADFETVYFQGWTGLERVEIPTFGWSLDNLVVAIPEPGTGALLLLSGLLLGVVRRRK